MDNLVSGMCGVGGYDRVPFKVVGVVRADAELKQQEPVQTGRNYWERTGVPLRVEGMGGRMRN